MNKAPIILERIFVPKDKIIFAQGEEGNAAFLIQSGKVQVYVEKENGQVVQLAKLKSGEIFGEMSLMFNGPRTATVKAIEDCNLVLINRRAFDDKLADSDPTVRAILNMLAKRLMNVNSTLLQDKRQLEDLEESMRLLYDNIYESLPQGKRIAFQDEILPHIDTLLDAINQFIDKNQD